MIVKFVQKPVWLDEIEHLGECMSVEILQIHAGTNKYTAEFQIKPKSQFVHKQYLIIVNRLFLFLILARKTAWYHEHFFRILHIKQFTCKIDKLFGKLMP